MSPLIDTEELAARLDDVRVFDIRWSLTDPAKGRSTYEAGHIPGAVFVDLDTDLSAPPGPGRHPLPDIATWTKTLGRLGVGADDEVVAYDDVGGVIAARMWWMLRSIGHHRSRLLDGGYRLWCDNGGPIETGWNQPSPTRYPPAAGFTGVVAIDQLETRIVVDARAPERYRGDNEPVDPKAGHIPEAINRPATANLGADGRFADPPTLRRLYEGLGSAPVMSCGSGVNACHSALAMVVAGYHMPEIYIGSFSEWSRLDRPVRTGPEP